MPGAGVYSGVLLGQGIFFVNNEQPASAVGVFSVAAETWSTEYDTIYSRFQLTSVSVEIDNGVMGIFYGGYPNVTTTMPSNQANLVAYCTPTNNYTTDVICHPASQCNYRKLLNSNV
jgi:hypothetical protein